MSRVAPEPSRVAVHRDAGRLVATVAVRRNWFAALFLTAWLGGWAVGEWMVVVQLLVGNVPAPAKAFMLFWLAGWTTGGVFVARQVAWSFVGREEVAVDGRFLSIRWSAGPFGRTREYDLTAVRNVRENVSLASSIARGFRVTTPGRHGALAFDYGAKTVLLGSDLEGEDVQKVLALLRERLPAVAA